MAKKSNRKPFRHKLPKGWRPGKGKTGTDHPSVVRDRNPIVRAALMAGRNYGHTHAIFRANPGCCPICQGLDGRRQRLTTVMSWKYQLPHPNCLCTWSTEKVVRKAEMVQNSSLMVAKKPVTLFVLTKGGGPIAGKAGLHKEKRTTKRGVVTKWVKDRGDVIEARTKAVAERRAGQTSTSDRSEHIGRIEESLEKLKEQEKREAQVKYRAEKEAKRSSKKYEAQKKIAENKEAKQHLNEKVEELKKVEPGGETTTKGGVKVERHKDGNRFKVDGIIFHGFRAASIGTSYMERLGATGAMTATGGLSHEVGKGGGQATRDVQAAGQKVQSAKAKIEAKAQEVKARREREKARQEAEKKAKSSKKKEEKSEEKK